VSRGTLRKALGVLEAEQLIVREPGAEHSCEAVRRDERSSASIRCEGATARHSAAGL
jgi:DNA-binding GntR family transcriptional regulator